MKILLVNPPYPKDQIFRKALRNVGALLPSLGLAYIAAVLEKHDHEVRVIDGPVLSQKLDYSFKDLETDIKKFNPDVIGVTSNSPQIRYAKDVLSVSKKVKPDATTLLGGPHITAMPNLLKGLKDLDYGVYGEGEYTFLEVIKKIENKKKVSGIKGLIFKDRGKVKLTPRGYVTNIDTLPFPARHLLPMKLYRPSPANYRRLPATTIMTSRGCPFNCVFCHKPTTGFKFRPHSPRKVVDEIEHLIDKYGIRDIQIFDDTFALDKRRTEKICHLIIEKKLDIMWNCMTRVSDVNPDLLKLMRRAGCYEIGYGVESGSERILSLIKKGVTKDMVVKAVKWTKNEGIDVRAFFMLGFPTETRKEILETINFAKHLDPTVAQFMVVTPYPGTELWDMCNTHGKINVLDWSNFTFYAPSNAPFLPNTLNPGELEGLYQKAFKSFYLRPSFIIKELKKIRSFNDINRAFCAAKAIIGI